MRKVFLFTYCLLFVTCSSAQNAWIQKADFGGTARTGAVGFSISTKGYIGTGWDSVPLSMLTRSFWEWDGDSLSPTYNTWTQKADFGESGKANAVGFSIGTKGYIGTGLEYISIPPFYAANSDFWEWDQSTNTWTRKTNFGGFGRLDAVGFSIGTKGYIGTGSTGNFTRDFWEWDGDTSSPTYDTWTQKADFGGTARTRAAGFSIGTKGYIGTGYTSISNFRRDFWEWDGDTSSPTYNTWTQKADFGGTARTRAVGFSIGTKGYIGTGEDSSGYKKDFWEYNPILNSWTQKANFDGTARIGTVGFSINGKGYVGTGKDSSGYKKDFWEFNANVNGIEEYDEIQVNISPNPFSETAILTVQSSKFKVQDLELKIFDTKGEEVYHQIVRNANEFIVRRNNLLSGIYFYSVSVNKKIIATGKIIIIG